MHETALEFGRAFFDVYLPPGHSVILDVGSQDINGTLRACAPPCATYIGVDIVPGKGVDLLLDDPHVLPFADQHFNAVVTTSCFEHDPMFWVTFLEIVRVTRRGGHIYVCAPSNGWYHRHPRDNWRFYPDAGLTLQDWARREGFSVTLVESFTGRRKRNIWNDFVMVFRQGPETAACGYISDRFPDVMNLRRGGGADTSVVNYTQDSEDQQLIRNLTQEIVRRDEQIAGLNELLHLYEDILIPDALERTSASAHNLAVGVEPEQN
jgi:hypothetical protein